mgnify:CR=1 FL=1
MFVLQDDKTPIKVVQSSRHLSSSNVLDALSIASSSALPRRCHVRSTPLHAQCESEAVVEHLGRSVGLRGIVAVVTSNGFHRPEGIPRNYNRVYIDSRPKEQLYSPTEGETVFSILVIDWTVRLILKLSLLVVIVLPLWLAYVIPMSLFGQGTEANERVMRVFRRLSS